MEFPSQCHLIETFASGEEYVIDWLAKQENVLKGTPPDPESQKIRVNN